MIENPPCGIAADQVGSQPHNRRKACRSCIIVDNQKRPRRASPALQPLEPFLHRQNTAPPNLPQAVPPMNSARPSARSACQEVCGNVGSNRQTEKLHRENLRIASKDCREALHGGSFAAEASDHATGGGCVTRCPETFAAGMVICNKQLLGMQNAL